MSLKYIESCFHFLFGVGDMFELGHDSGRYYSVNVPLKEGIDDENYFQIFKPVIEVC